MPKKREKGLPKITKKGLFMVFLTFFFVFMFVGYMRGRSIRYSPERLHWDLLHTHKYDFKLGYDSRGKKIISYTCPSNQYQYEIDGNSPHSMRDKSNLPKDISLIEPAILSDKEIVNSFLAGAGGAGGVASIWTVKEVFTYIGDSSKGGLSSGSKVKLIVSAVLGSLMGYEIGKWIALSNELTCDYEGYSKLLESPDVWREVERDMWWGEYERVTKVNFLGECGSTDEQVNRAQDKNFNDALTKLEQYKDGEVSVVGHDFSSSDFDALYDFEAAKNEYIRACGKTKD